MKKTMRERNVVAYAITASQIKKIHTVKGALCLDDDTYRAILTERFGVASSKELTRLQASDLIDELERQAIACSKWVKRTPSPKKFVELEGRYGMASPAQLRKIEAMWNDVSRMEEPDAKRKALRHFVERITRVSDLRFLNMDGACRVICALEAMKKRPDNKTAESIPH